MSDSLKQQKRQREIKECALELRKLSRMDANKFCADCGQRNPKWVSTNIGCWICMRCSGFHRNLGVHHSFVKSTTLDDWNYELLEQFKLLGGNSNVNALYEAKLTKQNKIKYQNETNDYKFKEFIRDKYVGKKWYSHKPIQKNKKKVNKRHHNKIHKQHHHNKVNTEARQQKKIEIVQSPKPKANPIDIIPKNWIKFTEKKETEKEEKSIDIVPDLIGIDDLYQFQFSDLATFDPLDGKQNDNKFNSIHLEKSSKSDKSAILSKYNHNPTTWKQFKSSTPKPIAMNTGYCNQFNFVPYTSYNQYNQYNQYNKYNQYNQYNQYQPYNQYNIQSPVVQFKSNYNNNNNNNNINNDINNNNNNNNNYNNGNLFKQNSKQQILSKYANQQQNIEQNNNNNKRNEIDLNTLQPFYLIDKIFDNSPSHSAGLKSGDLIIKFGSMTSSNQSPKMMQEIVKQSINKEIPVIIKRNPEGFITLHLTPQKWNGKGLLGCHLTPYPN